MINTKRLDHAAERVFTFVSSTLFFRLTVILFVTEALFFALKIRYGLPPDENYHYSFIQLLSQNLSSPFIDKQAGFSVVYDALRTPFFLYHYLLAFPYAVIRDFGWAYVFL